MSLDVYLRGPEKDVECTCECGHKHTRRNAPSFYDANITHNLGKMAEAAGIYEACWRPEEINIKQAKDLIPLLEEGLEKLKSDPKKYEAFNSPNGWGLYKHLVPWVEKYLNACKEYPEALISVSR